MSQTERTSSGQRKRLPKSLDAFCSATYPSAVPDKKGNRFERLPYLQRTNGAMPFFYVCTLLCFLRAAVVVSPRAAGCCRYRSINSAICRPPRLIAGRGVTTTYGGSYA